MTTKKFFRSSYHHRGKLIKLLLQSLQFWANLFLNQMLLCFKPTNLNISYHMFHSISKQTQAKLRWWKIFNFKHSLWILRHQTKTALTTTHLLKWVELNKGFLKASHTTTKANTQVQQRTTKDMVKEHAHGLTAQDMSAIGLKTSDMETDFLYYLKDWSTKVSGSTIASMVLDV